MTPLAEDLIPDDPPPSDERLAAPVADPIQIAGKYQWFARNNPNLWAKHALGIRLWKKQRKIMRMLARHSKVAVRSSNAVGKSYIAAVAAIWYLNQQCPGYVVTTSSSWTGIQKTLWPEIHARLDNAPFQDMAGAGERLQLEWKLGPHWGAFAVSPRAAENFAGFRTPRGVFVIIDEASALDPDIYDAIMGLTATEGSKVLMIGNPLRPEGPFYDCFHSDIWATEHITAYESPNVLFGQNIIPGLATAEWIEERKTEWGESSPAFVARVMGNFPEMAEDSVIQLHEVEAARERYKAFVYRGGFDILPAATNLDGSYRDPLKIGVDVARFGDDQSIVAARRGNHVWPLWRWQHKRTTETAGKVAAIANHIGADEILVDDIGVGGGVTDILVDADLKADVVGVNVGERPDKPDLYANCRTELWYKMRDWVQDSGRIPGSRGILPALTAQKYEFSKAGGQLKLVSKEKTKKALGKSPDEADAIMLTFYEGARLDAY